MANIIKDIVVSESAPVGKPGCLWIKYTPGTNSYQTMLPVGNGWQESNETLSKKEVEDGLGYTPESNGNKVTSISSESTDTQYPSAKAVYDAIGTIPAPSIGIPVETTMPETGMLPNVMYELGVLSGEVVFALNYDAEEQGYVNHYYWTFETGGTPPEVTYPANLAWAWGSQPELSANKHYEISLIDGYAFFVETPIYYTPIEPLA